MGQNSGTVTLIFVGALFSVHDYELQNFLHDAQVLDMNGQIAFLRAYQGVRNELENYELTGLSFDKIGVGQSGRDVKFVFKFRHLRHLWVT
jgi:hypothetical protein